MPQIHPTAIIDPRAELADNVEVGPHCVIDGEINIGPGCRLIGSAYLRGPLTLGQRNVVYPFACLGFEPQDRKFDGATAGVVIGDDNIFREGATVHCSTSKEHPTRIGNTNYFMTNAHVGHDCTVGDNCTMVTGTMLGGHVTMGDGAVIGGGGGVHQFCRVGRLAILSGIACVVQDLPPFCMSSYTKQVNALNIVGLRRAGRRQSIAPLKRAFDLLFKCGLPNQRAAQAILDELGDDPLCVELAQFVLSTKRGITAYRGADERGGES